MIGGGVAGMSAAHELITRGFEVQVFEAHALAGGKARSIAATAGGLPGEHGFRFFPSFYQHLTRTMREIPFPGNVRGVLDNLVDTTEAAATRFGRDLVMMNTGFPTTPSGFVSMADGLFGNPFSLSREESLFIGRCLMQIASSCDDRRHREYEAISWWDFIRADQFSQNYRDVFGMTTRSLVAADPRKASTKTIGDITLQAIIGMSTPGRVYDRVLNGPTSQAWIDPWLADLRARGVDYRLQHSVQDIEADHQGVVAVHVLPQGQTQPQRFEADWFIAAVPVERMAKLLNPQITALDPNLSRIGKLANSIGWMNGLQYYLRQPRPIVHGHLLHVDTPWALTSISQAQFWPRINFSTYADGEIRDSLSIDISDWDTPGLNGKTARQCTHDEIIEETWRQLQMSLNTGGVLRLPDEIRHSEFLDPSIEFDPNTHIVSQNTAPLLINEAGTWADRPAAATRIRNLFLASDYVRTKTDLACMEGANEAARRAVNGLLEASAWPGARCGVWNLPEPEILRPWRRADQQRHDKGLPWDGDIFD